MAKNCSICGQEIGLLSYIKEYEGGKRICKDCAVKAGILNSDYQNKVPFEVVKEWIEDPNKRTKYFERIRKEEEENKKKELERIEFERKKREEEKRKEDERRQDEIREAEERQRKEKERALAREKELFPDGRIKVALRQVSFTRIGATFSSGNALDSYLQKLQDQGCRIINVTCFASGDDNNYVQAVVVYKTPPIGLNTGS